MTLDLLNRVVLGPGAVDRLGRLARELGATRALLVSDPGVHQSGHVNRALQSLRGSSVEVHTFEGVEQNPTTHHVEEGHRFARDLEIECIIGLGGGSAMDCAKGINFLLTNGGRMEDYWGTDRAPQPLLPAIGVPTTAGTGSEAQSYCLIEQEESRLKMACGDPTALFRSVILDPELTTSTPAEVRAAAGLDAISHAVESYVTTRRTPESQELSRLAWTHLQDSFEPSLEDDAGIDVRGRMLYGAYLAGAAIEKSMLGAAHACANPLTSRFEVAHGAAVLLTLPHVVRFNEPVAGGLYRELMERTAGGGALAERLLALRDAAGLPGRLRDIPVPREALPGLARDAAEQWTATFNPRPVEEADLLELYERAF